MGVAELNSDYGALRALQALVRSAGYAATFATLGLYRTELHQQLAGCSSQAARELAALLASDAYAISFQSMAQYRAAMLATLEPHVTPIEQIHMEILDAQLKFEQNPPAGQPDVDAIAALQDRIASQQAIMDKCASTLTDALMSDAGLDTSLAESCIDAIRTGLNSVGKSTTEQLLQNVYDHVGAAAGLPPGTSFNLPHVCTQMRVTLAAQSQNAGYLEYTLKSLYWKTPDGKMRLRTSLPGQAERFLTFEANTPWTEALDTAMTLPDTAEAA